MVRLLPAVAALVMLLTASGAFASTVDINTAGPAELAAALTGVGASKAEAIVKYRRANGPFRSVDDLVNVTGIGKAIVEQNRKVITVGKPPKPGKLQKP